MSTSAFGSVVFGVKLKFDSRMTKQVQKFNEDDGSPYNKSVDYEGLTLPDGTVWDMDEIDDDLYDNVYCSLHGPYYGDRILGKTVVSVDYGETDANLVTLGRSDEAAVIDALKGYGITEAPSYYLVSYLS